VLKKHLVQGWAYIAAKEGRERTTLVRLSLERIKESRLSLQEWSRKRMQV